MPRSVRLYTPAQFEEVKALVVVIPPGSPRLVIEVGGADPGDAPAGEPQPAPRLMVVTDNAAP
jgi:hypothetical protein